MRIAAALQRLFEERVLVSRRRLVTSRFVAEGTAAV
jgi:hypothetical protein